MVVNGGLLWQHNHPKCNGIYIWDVGMDMQFRGIPLKHACTCCWIPVIHQIGWLRQCKTQRKLVLWIGPSYGRNGPQQNVENISATACFLEHNIHKLPFWHCPKSEGWVMGEVWKGNEFQKGMCWRANLGKLMYIKKLKKIHQGNKVRYTWKSYIYLKARWFNEAFRLFFYLFSSLRYRTFKHPKVSTWMHHGCIHFPPSWSWSPPSPTSLLRTKKKILLMKEILHHPTCRKPYKKWNIYHIKWCRISEPSTASQQTKSNIPTLVAMSINFSAFGPWPCPNEMLATSRLFLGKANKKHRGGGSQGGRCVFFCFPQGSAVEYKGKPISFGTIIQGVLETE